MSEHWLTILIVLLIAVIVVDGIRRMRKARRDSLKMALRPVSRANTESDEEDKAYGSEFPSGGARPSNRKIDADRIKQARDKFDFGQDMSAWRTKVADKISAHTKHHEEDEPLPAHERVEPSFEELDPLLDELPAERTRFVRPESQATVEEEELDEIREEVTMAREDYADDVDEYEEVAEEESIVDAEHKKAADDLFHEELDRDQSDSDLEDQPKPKAPRVKKNALPDDQKPVQVSLNLDDSVPMLMDTLEGGSDEPENTVEKEVAESEDEEASVKPSTEKEAPEKDPIVSVGARVKSPEQEETTHSANKPRYESKYADHKQAATSPQDVLVIHVRAQKNEYFYGDALLELVLDCGLRFGAMNIFHRHADEDGEGPVIFSMANMVKPGTFDLHNFEELSTVGISFFVTLPAEIGSNMDAFEAMLQTATHIATKLDGELQDENRSVLTKQTIEHYRERVRDFSRKQQLEKNKP